MHWLLAESYAALGRSDDALQHYRLLLDRAPDSPLADEAAYRLGYLLQQRGDFAEAARRFGKLAADRPASPLAPRALFAAAYCHQKLEQHAEAARDWAAVAERYPTNALAEEALYQRAVSEVRLRRGTDALEAFRRLIETHPRTEFATDARYWRGVLLVETGRVEDAESELRACLSANPRVELRREAEFALALALQKQGSDAEASKLLLPLAASPLRERFTPALLEWLAEARLREKDPAGALEVTRMLVTNQESENALQAGWQIAGEAHLAQGAKGEARAAFQKAVDAEARTPRGARAALRLGELALGDGDAAGALKYYELAAEQSRSDELLAVRAEAYAGLGRASQAAGHPADAARYFMSVAILYDDDTLVPACLRGAVEAFRAAGMTNEAAQAAEELVRRTPAAAGTVPPPAP